MPLLRLLFRLLGLLGAHAQRERDHLRGPQLVPDHLEEVVLDLLRAPRLLLVIAHPAPCCWPREEARQGRARLRAMLSCTIMGRSLRSSSPKRPGPPCRRSAYSHSNPT